ncbi:hypothetical protein [Planococcus halocryophilus]|uniref:hypothetical protein n=1 Tax=Planococcus halocryophilus TaxID=1215089 RepID=UPI001F10E165|nr:hypothetical protein [Planococcus halocryophilus]MCH4826773.1 hypothetical protein [Planococcus halocryophilus]
MRRSIINPKVKQPANQTFSLSKQPNRVSELSGLALDKSLRQKRSSEYIEVMTKLDAGSMLSKQQHIDELKQSIRSEFPDLSPSQYLIGIVSKCYLGNPYTVHSLDMSLDILQHYKRGEVLPDSMERARSLALHPGYEFIEVYNNELRAISTNGDVAVIKG